jgi:anthraniloyl-CoA monooxygenase
MKIVRIGGGPSGLYFALLMKKLGAHHDVSVVERNKPYDTFGCGVVFSDQKLDNMRQWDSVSAAKVEQAFIHWDDIERHFKRGCTEFCVKGAGIGPWASCLQTER